MNKRLFNAALNHLYSAAIRGDVKIGWQQLQQVEKRPLVRLQPFLDVFINQTNILSH